MHPPRSARRAAGYRVLWPEVLSAPVVTTWVLDVEYELPGRLVRTTRSQRVTVRTDGPDPAAAAELARAKFTAAGLVPVDVRGLA